MLNFATQSMHRFNNSPGSPGRKNSRVRFRTLSPLRGLCGLLLAVTLVLVSGLVCPAAAIEFITREAFNVEKSSYKAYPAFNV